MRFDSLLETVKNLERNLRIYFDSSFIPSRWYKMQKWFPYPKKLIVKGKKINGEMYDVEVTNIKINQ